MPRKSNNAHLLTKRYGKVHDACNKEEKKLKIFEIVKSRPEGVNARYVNFQSDLNYSTIRSYLRELVKDGLVYQPTGMRIYKSAINTTYGIAPVEPKVQNIRLKYDVPPTVGVVSERAFVPVGNIRLHLTFGERHRCVTASVGAEPSLNPREFKAVVEIFKLKVKERIGIEPADNDVIVRSFELNQDYFGIRLDGLNCVTLRDFSGFLEKIYNRRDCVRREVKISQPTSLESLYTLLTGGFKNYVLVDRIIRIEKELDRLKKHTGLSNSNQRTVIGLLKALLEKFDKISATPTRKVKVVTIEENGAPYEAILTKAATEGISQ